MADRQLEAGRRPHNKDFLRSTAVHESGHAVGAIRAGWEFDSIVIHDYSQITEYAGRGHFDWGRAGRRFAAAGLPAKTGKGQSSTAIPSCWTT